MNRFLLLIIFWTWASVAPTLAMPAVVIRFAHNQLEPSVIRAFDQVAESYMTRHPEVRIEQILVPARVYRSWIRTQLIGGTAPQLIELTPLVTQDLLARYFLPLSQEVGFPNPYNAGTPLEHVPWQGTFWDGLNSKPNYSAVLVQHYGIPNTLLTRRVIYNRDLFVRLTGAARVPRTSSEFIQFAEIVTNARPGLTVVPLVTHGDHVEALLEHCISAVSHDLALRLDHTRRRTGWDFEPAQGYLTGAWSLRSPEIAAGLEAFQRIGRYLPLGANQFVPQDASFMFLQGRAVALIATSAEASALRELVPFPLVIGPLPLPGADDETLGRFFAHPLAEADLRSSGSFGIVRGAAHSAVALDFLRWMSSQAVHQRFVATSGWNPVVRGVVANGGAEPFQPVLSGVPSGIRLMLFGDETSQLVRINLHRLIGPRASVNGFIDAVEPGYRDALRRGWQRNVLIESRNIIRLDGSIAAAWSQPDSSVSEEQAELLADQRINLELTQKWTEFAPSVDFRVQSQTLSETDPE